MRKINEFREFSPKTLSVQRCVSLLMSPKGRNRIIATIGLLSQCQNRIRRRREIRTPHAERFVEKIFSLLETLFLDSYNLRHWLAALWWISPHQNNLVRDRPPEEKED